MLAYFGPLSTNEHRSNVTAHLTIVADHVHPFTTTVYHLLMTTSSRITHHTTKLNSMHTLKKGNINKNKSTSRG